MRVGSCLGAEADLALSLLSLPTTVNLVSGLEEDPNAFRYTVYAGLGTMTIIMAVGWLRMVRNRRSQLFLRSYARARPQTKPLKSGSLNVPQVKARDMIRPAAPVEAAKEGGQSEESAEWEKEEKEAQKKEREAEKAKKVEEEKESQKDGSTL